MSRSAVIAALMNTYSGILFPIITLKKKSLSWVRPPVLDDIRDTVEGLTGDAEHILG